jgi:hypothetical protein
MAVEERHNYGRIMNAAEVFLTSTTKNSANCKN